jgi:phospholipid N-methyltransferase
MAKITKFKTSLEFTKNIKTTGAFRQTSKKVEQEITKYVSKERKQVIVEFGTGHGNITKQILDKMHPDSKLYTFEVNQEFCELVSAEIKDTRLHVINAGAETLIDHVVEPIDIVISSIPITLLPRELAKRILSTTYEHMTPKGTMSQILYTKLHKKKFEAVFDDLSIKRIFNVPMEYVHHGMKK